MRGPVAPLLGSLLLAAAVSCGSGSDGGSSSSTAAAGTGAGGDPSADSDGDFLTNAEEASLGTDPASSDTDGDTYLDGDEVLEKTDPLDPASKIYEGGWPYQRKKDDIADPGFDGSPTIGGLMPRLVATDQFGQLVDLYDFAMHGKPVVLDLSAPWCGPCKDLAAWLAGEPSDLDAKTELASIPGLVSSGKIYWVTVVFDDAVGNPASPEQAAAWAESFPNAKVTVLAGDDHAMYDYLFPGGFPSIQVIDEDMTLRAYDRFDYDPALHSLLE